MTSHQEMVSEQVTEFYRSLPFNYEQTVADTSRTIQENNQIAATYPALDAILAPSQRKCVLDVGCGAGWFVNTVAHHYGLEAVGVDLCEPAIYRAQEVSKSLGLDGKVRYACADLFKLLTIQPTSGSQFFLVNSLGVLHHTHDCREALLNIADFVEPYGFIHVGLYHRYGRQPFLDLFRPYREEFDASNRESDRRAIEQQAFSVYKALDPFTADETLLLSWFRDQVFHPHESQHTLHELYGWLTSIGFQLLSTSINKFQTPNDLDGLFEEEKKMYDLSYQRNVCENKYFPGFFTVLAQRRS
jgi:SAM-dependent methyltransferase